MAAIFNLITSVSQSKISIDWVKNWIKHVTVYIFDKFKVLIMNVKDPFIWCFMAIYYYYYWYGHHIESSYQSQAFWSFVKLNKYLDFLCQSVHPDQISCLYHKIKIIYEKTVHWPCMEVAAIFNYASTASHFEFQFDQ